MAQELKIDPSTIVNDMVATNPATLPVFSRVGIDTCCGGGLPIAEAARRHGLDLDALVADLAKAASAPA